MDGRESKGKGNGRKKSNRKKWKRMERDIKAKMRNDREPRWRKWDNWKYGSRRERKRERGERDIRRKTRIG